MQSIIDHTAAVIIGAVVLFALAAVALRSQSGAIAATQVDMAKTDLRVLVDALEQDLTNAGSGMANPNAGAADRVVTTYSQSGGATTLSFPALTDDGGSPDPTSVTYSWEQDGTTTLPDGSTAPTYEVTRQADGTTATFGSATDFTVTLRDDDLNEVAPGASADDLALVRYVDVSVRLISPLSADDVVEQTQWSKRYRPINMDDGNRRIAAAKPPGS